MKTLIILSSQLAQGQNRPYLKVTAILDDGSIVKFNYFNKIESYSDLSIVYSYSCTSNNGYTNYSLTPLKGVTPTDSQLTVYNRLSRTLPNHPQVSVSVVLSTIRDFCSEIGISLSSSQFTHLESLFNRYSHHVAALVNHHNQEGGLLTHTFEVITLFRDLVKSSVFSYQLSPSLIFEGIIAICYHDSGKLDEYIKTDGVWHYNNLAFPHTVSSLSYVHDFPELSKEQISSIEKIILQHHGVAKWGSPVSPNTLVSYLVHISDLSSAVAWDSLLNPDNLEFPYSRL